MEIQHARPVIDRHAPASLAALRARSGPRDRWYVLLTVMLGTMAAIMASTIVNVAVPDLLRQVGGATGVGLIGVFLAWRLHADPGSPIRAFHEAFVLLGVLTAGAAAAAWGTRRR